MVERDHEPVESQAEPVAAPLRELAPDLAGAALAVAAPARVAPAARVLALQRAAGNRAVNRLLARAEQSGTVSEEVSEDLIVERNGEKRFHWTAKFSYEINDDEIVGILNVRTYPDADVTMDEAIKCRQEARTEFTRLFNARFVIEEEVDWAINPKRVLKLGVNYVSDHDNEPEHLHVAIHKGAGGDNRTNWYTNSPGIAHAHELAHAFGLKDEYVDTNVKGRSHSGAENVREDNSIMGDFPNEGVEKAAMKDRHALRIAQLIFRAAGKPPAKLTARAVKK